VLGAALPGAQLIVIRAEDIDLDNEESATAALDHAGLADVDGIIAVASDVHDCLTTDAATDLTELLFLCVRHRLTAVASGHTLVGAVCLAGLDSQGLPSAQSGLVGGLLKSVQRELPEASCRSIITDGELSSAIAALTREWGGQGPVEVALRHGRRQRFALVDVPVASHPGQAQANADSVVVATGGARGVTAVLMEALQRKHGCKIALLGRSDIGAVPAELVAMDDPTFDAYEPEFYRKNSTDGRKLGALRSEFATLRSRREAARNVQRLAELPGELIYVPCDITDAAAVQAAVDHVTAQFGAPTLLVHGAGLQVSGALAKRSLDTFRRVVRTKIGGLANLLSATHDQAKPPAVHVLTSVFSFLGNDGQPDYGAANEGMNRLVERRQSTDRHWSALAWLGWAAVGMTRGSEYAALASARGLRPVTKQEGSQIFLDALAGPRASGAQVITAGELAWAREPLLPSETPVMGLCWPLTVESLPLVDRHLVGGMPTLPGTFGMDLALQAGRAFRPGWQLAEVTDLTWARFVRLRDGLLRSEIRQVSRDDDSCVLDVRLLSDFVHDSGVVLDTDIEHFSVRLHLRPASPSMPEATTAPLGELQDTPPDPYHQAQSPVTLLEPFDPVERIQLFDNGRTGIFTPTERVGAIAHFESPAVVMDAICRFAMVCRTEESMPVFVPIHCGWFRFAPGMNDAALVDVALELRASPPILNGEHVRCAQAEVVHPNGDVLLVARDLLALRVGHVQAISNDGSHS
jgi:NAD(P)-dependent dehydrogenase (short-subunit alcohol dehydrogenase family)